MYKKTSILVLTLALLIPIGCAQNQQASLDNQIESSLDNQNLKDVDADVQQGGKVVLTGTVEDEQQKLQAEQAARNVSGVTDVENLIKVKHTEGTRTDTGIDTEPDTNTPTTGGDTTTGDTASNDTWLSFKTKLALYADNRVSGTDIDVESNNGDVTLIGKVPTNEAKNAAFQVAQQIKGVKKVNNQLQVVPTTKREVVDEKDSSITDNVENRLEQDAQLKDVNFSVSTNNGVVTLTGTADNIDHVEKALQVVSSIKGVKAVNANAVTIKNQPQKKGY
ncbi:MAG: BON domain-containing protein [Acidobacteriota bacterium]